MKLKSIFKKSLSTLLAISSIIAYIPTTSYAGIEGNSQGNNSDSAITGSGGDFGVNLPAGRIGLRFSVINGEKGHEGEVISENVIDYWFMTKANFRKYTIEGAATTYFQPGGGYYEAVKTQKYTTENNIKTILLDDSKYDDFPLNTLKADPESWAYHDGAYHSTGREYVEWLGKDAQGNQSGVSVSEYMKGYLKLDQYQIKPTKEALANGKRKNYSIYVNRNTDSSITINFINKDTGKEEPLNLDHGYNNGKGLDEAYRKWSADSNLHNLINADTMAKALGLVVGMDTTISDKLREKALGDIDDAFGTDDASYAYNYCAENYGVVDAAGESERNPVDSNTESNKSGESQTIQTMTQEQFKSFKEGMSPVLQILNYTPKDSDVPLLKTDGLKKRTIKVTNSDGSTEEHEVWDWDNNTDKWILLVEPLFMLTIFGSTDDENHIILCKQVGTITNLAEAIGDLAPASPAYTSTNWYNWKALNQSLWSALSVQYGKQEKPKLDIKDASGKSIGTIDNPFTSMAYPATSTRTFQSMNENPHEEGYGVCMWWAGNLHSNSNDSGDDIIGPPDEDKGTHTFDSEKYGTGNSPSGKYEKGPAPEPTPEEKKEGVSKTNNIVKFYANKAGTTYTYTDNNVRKDTISPIQIEDEELYIVDGWFTSETFKDPTGNKSESFDAYKSSLHNKKVGDRLDLVSLDNNDTLYIRLINNSLTIIKYFTDSSGKNISQPKIEKDLERTPTYDPADGAWTYKEAVLTNNPPVNATNWGSVPSGSHTTSNPIPVSDGTQTIYIRYIQDGNPKVLTLHEDELAHTFQLKDIDGLIGEFS